MDINSLLSPQEAPRSKPSTPGSQPQSPHRHVPRARSGSFRPAPTSPFSNSTIPASSLPQYILSPIRTSMGMGSSPAISPTGGVYGATPPRGDFASSRSSSTHNMDTLADIASM